MATPASPPAKIRFDSFELDVASGELRKSGGRLKLQPQPFRVLLLLIERGGQVVTREEIQHCLWKDSTFVDFEHGINFSINQIRGALSDSAERPRYVETLPRRGYRFIGTLEQPSPPLPDNPPEPESPPKQESAQEIRPEAKPRAARMPRRRWPVIAALTILAAAITVGAYVFFRRAPRLTGQDTIVLADFANTTGDPAFDGALRQALAMQLRQSPFLSVLSEARIRRTLPLMGEPADAPLTSQVARQVCMRTGSAALVEGSIGGLYEKGLDEAREALRLDPSDPLNYAVLVYSYLTLNRMGEARSMVQEAEKNGFGSTLHGVLYHIAFLENDAAGMSRQLAWAAGKAGLEDEFLGQEADTAAYSGRLTEARGFSRRAVASAERAELKETKAEHEADIALIEAVVGNEREAQEQANNALGHSTGRDVQYGAALALALTRNSARAQSLADDLGRRFPDDTLVKFSYLPTLRAQVALNKNSAAQAIDTLQAAIPYDLGNAATGGAFALNLYPVYVRGNAYLAAHRGAEAAAEFNKILAQRGIVGNEPIGALAHLGLARAYAIDGDIGKSRAAYQDFFGLWTNADPDVPRLVEARAEYSRLK